MRYEEWLAQVPEGLKRDPVWKSEAYPKALLLFDLVWEDSGKLMKDVRGREIGRQLIRSAGSVSANIDEGSGVALSGGNTCNFCAIRLVPPARRGVGTSSPANPCLNKSLSTA